MNSDGTAGALVSVNDGVIGLRADLTEQMMLRLVIDGSRKLLHILVHRRCEWMMRRRVSIAIFVVLEHRELGHDQRFIGVAVNQVLVTGNLITQSAESRGDDRFAARDDQNGVAFFSV